MRLAIKDLLKRLEEENLPSSRQWLANMISSGKIVLPTYKHTDRTPHYNLTPEIIEEIVDDLKKKGEYIYAEKENV